MNSILTATARIYSIILNSFQEVAFLKGFDCGSEERIPDVGLCHLWQMTAPHSQLGPVIGGLLFVLLLDTLKLSLCY